MTERQIELILAAEHFERCWATPGRLIIGDQRYGAWVLDAATELRRLAERQSSITLGTNDDPTTDR